MNINDFINYLKDLNINPTKEQLDKLDKYYKLLVETNKITNLTRIIEEKEVYLKHFYDSLTITKCIDLNKVDTYIYKFVKEKNKFVFESVAKLELKK